MNPDTALAQLHDIHLPAPPGYWPLAPGWWLLISISALIIIGGMIIIYRHRSRNRWRRQALAQLNQLMQTPMENKDKLAQLQILLKQVAHKLENKQDVKTLSGQSWRKYLETHAQGIFTEADLALLENGLYQPGSIRLDSGLFRRCRQWIEQAKVLQQNEVAVC